MFALLTELLKTAQTPQAASPIRGDIVVGFRQNETG